MGGGFIGCDIAADDGGSLLARESQNCSDVLFVGLGSIPTSLVGVSYNMRCCLEERCCPNSTLHNINFSKQLFITTP